MPFQEFTDVRKRVDRAPRLGVQSKGRVSINPAGLEALGKPTHVVLLFDPDAMRLGIRGATEEEGHSYRLTETGKETDSRTVSLVALFHHYGIQVDEDRYVGSYPAAVETIGAHTALVITLRPAKDSASPPAGISDDDIPF